MARAVSPTNTNFRLTFLLTRLQERSLHHLYHIVTNFPEICAFIIGFSFTVWTKKSVKRLRKQVTMLTKFVSIGRYSHEVRTFGTLIMST